MVFCTDLDKVMASLIIANGALAMGKPVALFITFWGLNVLRRGDAPAQSKPFVDRMFGAMMPAGVSRLNSISKMNFAGMGAWLIRQVMRDKRVEEAANLLRSLQQGGAQLIACQMSMDAMGIRHAELVDGVELRGVAALLGEAHHSATTLFIQAVRRLSTYSSLLVLARRWLWRACGSQPRQCQRADTNMPRTHSSAA